MSWQTWRVRSPCAGKRAGEPSRETRALQGVVERGVQYVCDVGLPLTSSLPPPLHHRCKAYTRVLTICTRCTTYS